MHYPRLRAPLCGWALAVLSFASPQLQAADYMQGVAVSGSTATIWFKSKVNTSWVDAHYQVSGGVPQNVRMNYVASALRYEHAVPVSAGKVLSYSFTYNNGTPAYDTPTLSYTVGGSNPAEPPPPTTSGTVCFYDNASYGGGSYCADADSGFVGAAWNDRISSLKLQPGHEIELFEHANYGGRSRKLTADASSLGDFDNVVSSFRVKKSGPGLPTSDTPDFGPNVVIFDPSTPASTIQSRLDAAFSPQVLSPTAQFGAQRHAFLFKPGKYSGIWANLGFYTSIVGLGQKPDDVTIQGSVNVDSGWNYGDAGNATQNFWRSAENFALVPSGGTNRWAVSQAAPMRRVHIIGNLHLGPSNQDHGQGYSSGGYLADSKVDGSISSGSQQQWYTRDSHIGVWYDGVWNMVFSGVVGAPATSFPAVWGSAPPYTSLPTTPVSREKPFLYVDGAGKYRVFVPALRSNASGASWASGTTAGSSIPMSRFYVAKPGDSAATLNQALAQGLNLFFTPGTYRLKETIKVTRANTVVLGIGFATLVPENGVTAMTVADVDGVRIAGLLFDAGTVNSPSLLTVGTRGAATRHASNPTTIQDVFFRIGGAVAGKASTSLIVNSHDTLIDHIWAWRADHGSAPTGWSVNPADTGVIVNGDHVLATGLFVEHYEKYEVIWNGENGKTIFFQNEKPYDVPEQSVWRSPAGNGYAAYKVADHVKTHEGWGMGSYCYFNVNPSVNLFHGFEVPDTPGVRLHNVFTVSLGGVGSITHIVNKVGGTAQGVQTIPQNLISYP
ncbi:peptidase inhibitor family I36 protein [Aquabacterium sp. A7-Y]|uniref:peptidase inhibitor family I36 protein n=1 Tax=Aquabacterium sp. A7-Y TaxID=1349605 RepID=UPI00223CE3D1|nr:peptidase inhibitor family I36 protein [Aquabacterium sp. A7-Y]MCW7539474.1 peptidase inhibitor family I36 protein [Aquabacterium sp. A7-Y]